ncbi:metallophosphoesterase family protein [Candidatus Micrarchaeota archaeon]|nr:metallophosphoesterase family protein [Candidatus Micrarchaeota archaeon]
MKFLYNAPGILHKGALIVGDTHFGMEYKLKSRGIFDDQFSTRLLQKLEDLIGQHKVKRLIFLGDVKEDITYLDEKTRKILARLSEICEIAVVKGNHDGRIEEFLGAEVYSSDGFLFENLGLLHGHSWPKKELMQADYLIMGHQHPMIGFTDRFGKRHSELVWIVADPDADKIRERYDKFNEKIKLVLMPAFNPLVGFPINFSKKEQLGPLLNNKLFKLNHALVFRLDGTCLGELNKVDAHGEKKARA